MSLAMMVVESDGNPLKPSPVGARGLMQVMPDTVRELAAFDKENFGYLLDAKGNARMNLLDDPKTGVKVGMAALKMYMDRYDGDAEKALIAYNWGPANVGKKEADLTAAQKKGYDQAQTYVKNIRRVLRTTDGSDSSGNAPDQSEGDRYAPLPQPSLLHYLPGEKDRPRATGSGGR